MTKKLTWDPKVANVYRKMLPPGPPSKSELKIYERYIKEVKRKRDPKILILGSTAGTRIYVQNTSWPILPLTIMKLISASWARS